METPCIKICTNDPGSGLCRGCGRTLEEIAVWAALGADERQRIMEQLPARLRRGAVAGHVDDELAFHLDMRTQRNVALGMSPDDARREAEQRFGELDPVRDVLVDHDARRNVRTERALYEYVNELKASHMKSAPPLAKVAYDAKLHVVRNALGTHSAVSRIQGDRLQAKREIRIAALFKEAPADFLRMIVVHELAHMKQREHDKAFYALCLHMEPDYHRLELDLRLWLTAQELSPRAAA